MPIVILLLLAIVLLVVLGGVVVGLTLTLLGYAITGLVIGALARLVLPGDQGLGILATILFGVAGSLLGGILGDAVGLGAILQFVLAVAVAALLITLFGPRFSRRPAV